MTHQKSHNSQTDKHKFIYITNINQITQSDTNKVHKFIYITNISHITQSHKEFFFDKTKRIRPKTLVNWSHKKVTNDLPNTSLTDSQN